MEFSYEKSTSTEARNPVEEHIQPMPIRRIATYVGKSYDWVQSRVENFSDEIIELPDANNHMRVNYTPKAILALKAEADATRQFPVVKPGDISLTGLSLALGRERKWVEARLLILDIKAIEKRNSANRILGFYDEENDLELLRAEDERIKSYPVATEEYSTATGLAETLGHNLKWVRRRLRYITTLPTIMLNPGNMNLDAYFLTDDTAKQINELPNHFHHLRHRQTNIIHPTQEPIKVPKTSLPMAAPYVRRSEITLSTTLSKPIALAREESVPYNPVDSPTYKPADINTNNWMSFAECAEIDPNLFSAPEQGGNMSKAKAICGQCAVKLFCLDYALVNDEQTGIYGGLSPGERKKLKLELKAIG